MSEDYNIVDIICFWGFWSCLSLLPLVFLGYSLNVIYISLIIEVIVTSIVVGIFGVGSKSDYANTEIPVVATLRAEPLLSEVQQVHENEVKKRKTKEKPKIKISMDQLDVMEDMIKAIDKQRKKQRREGR